VALTAATERGRLAFAVATTAVFAEILIVGLEAAAWLSLLVAAIFGTSWVEPGRFEGWEALATIIVIAGAYVLGILVDRFADSLQQRLDRAWPSRPADKPAGLSRMRVTMLQTGGDLARFLEYQRSRLRIARSTAVNCLIASPIACWYIWSRGEVAAAVSAGGALLLAAALAELAYRRIEFAYVTRLSDAYRIVTNPEKPKANRAAAIPYQKRDGVLKFLLVTTKDDDSRWTFPKGRRDPQDRTFADTAAREAREEAGVTGRLEGRRLTTYRFPTRSGKPRRVAAFLLKVRGDVDPDIGGEDRITSWSTYDDALVKLSEGREPEYREEMKRVLDAAVAALDDD
jgi:8-oxo-dGTP pyrophosphatase MutT (NUDIX family)